METGSSESEVRNEFTTVYLKGFGDLGNSVGWSKKHTDYDYQIRNPRGNGTLFKWYHRPVSLDTIQDIDSRLRGENPSVPSRHTERKGSDYHVEGGIVRFMDEQEIPDLSRSEPDIILFSEKPETLCEVLGLNDLRVE